MTTRQQVLAKAAEMGAVVDDDPTGAREEGLRVEAPPGYRWTAYDVHESCTSYFREPGSKAGAWDFLFEAMSQGVQACTDPDCEWCESNGLRYEDGRWGEE